MLHTVPRIDDPESMFGYTRSGTSQDYILLGPPSPIRGPTFEKYGNSCVGAYVVRVMSQEDIPYGPVCLAIWPDSELFGQGSPACAVIEMGQLISRNDSALKKTWVRLGVSLYLKDEEVEPIMEGDAETLREVLRDGRGVPDGDSYIPSVTVEKFNKDYGTEYDGEPEFCL